MTDLLRTIFIARACISCVTVSSCDKPDVGERASVISSEEQGLSLTSLQDIEGFWLVERFENFEPLWQNDTPWRRAYLQIEDGRLTYSVGCNQSGNSASLGSDGILHDIDEGSRMQTLIGCGPIRKARDERFFGFFSSSPKVRSYGQDRISLQSDAGTLILIQPEVWREENKPAFSEIEGRWVPQASSTYDGWGSAGLGFGDDQGVITIGRRSVVWSKCPHRPISISWTSDARLTSRNAIDVNDCPAVGRATKDGPGAIMTMLTADPAVIRVGADRIVLIEGSGAEGRRLDLQSEKSVRNPPPLPPIPDEYPPPPPHLHSARGDLQGP